MTDEWPTRRRLLELSSGAFVAGLAGCTEGDGPGRTTPSTPERTLPDAVDLETVVDGVEAPTDVAFPAADDRMYVATKGGRILVHDADGLRDVPLLDIPSQTEWGYEMGLLGIALHPSFDENRRLFVRYSGALRDEAPDDYDHTFVLAEFEASEDGLRVDPDSERPVLEIHQPQGNHNSGSLAFGPDGYLYVATGDGGGANDTGLGHVESWYGENEGGNGQNTDSTLLGGILRIDVDDRDGDREYAVPDDNPLVDEDGHRDEYYAWGLRNPWGTSFDDDRFFVADVGQGRREEINLVEKGENYGWNVKEGSTCFDTSDRLTAPDGCPDATPDDVRGGEPLIDPILEYSHSQPNDAGLVGEAIIGGHVYRGDALPELDGTYVFGNLTPDGELFLGIPPADEGGEWLAATLELTDGAADKLERLLAFGRDDDGEVYVLGGGGVHRLVPAE